MTRFRLPGWRRPLSLSLQLATILAISIIMCAILIIIATQVFDYFEQLRIVNSLPPAARRAGEAILAGRDPTIADLRALTQVQASITEEATWRSSIALSIFTLLAAGAAFVLGRVLHSRIGRGLNDVAAAARAVSHGNLSARARPIRWASVEEAQLIDDFNAMAQALADAERELRDSTAAIAHELRTPLTVLNGRLHGMRDGVFPTGPDQIESMLSQVESMTRIVDDLRLLSLIHSGQMTLDLAALDLADVAATLLAAVEPDLAAAGLIVERDLRPAPMIGDAARLRQALAAVLSNAMRYAPGSGPLRLETGLGLDGVFVRVLDRGPGLSAEGEARAFERFWRGEQSRARVSGGSGLGLSVVRAIAAAHHGQASLTSRDGGGAAFAMILPPVQPALDQIST